VIQITKNAECRYCPVNENPTATQISDYQFKKRYVAVSYPWEPSENENHAVGGYEIESADGQFRTPSEDVVLDRATNYASWHGVGRRQIHPTGERSVHICDIRSFLTRQRSICPIVKFGDSNGTILEAGYRVYRNKAREIALPR
jgi:hypothetical protein